MAFFRCSYSPSSMFQLSHPAWSRSARFSDWSHMSPWAGLDDLFNMDIDDDSVFPVSLARGHWGPSRFRQPNQFQVHHVQGQSSGNKRVRTKSSSSDDGQKWSTTVDMSAFKPENITVRLNYNQLQVRAHCEKTHPLYGQLEMSASRDILIPHDVDPASVRPLFTEQGKLVIEGTRKPLAVTYKPLENASIPEAMDSAQKVAQIKEEVAKATDEDQTNLMEVAPVAEKPPAKAESKNTDLATAEHLTGGSTNLMSWFDSLFGGAASLSESPIVQEADGTKKFLVKYDLGDFKPEDIKVKLLSGNYLKIDAIHEEKEEDHNMFSEFHRTYKVPDGVNVEALAIKLGKDGVLSVTAPMLALNQSGERDIPITHE